jgi:hypothetical protein
MFELRRFKASSGAPQPMVREASHLRHLVRAYSQLLHQTPGRIRAVRRGFPVTVVGPLRERFGVGVSLDGNVIRNLSP